MNGHLPAGVHGASRLAISNRETRGNSIVFDTRIILESQVGHLFEPAAHTAAGRTMANDYYGSASAADTLTASWLADIRRQVRPRRNLVPCPSKCALLVIDMQRHFCSPEGRAYLPASAHIVPRVARLVSAFKGAGGRIVFTRHGHSGPEDTGMLGRFWSDFLRSNELDAAIVSGTGITGSETLLPKKTYDAFLNTPLEHLLHEWNCTQVLVTGVMANLCCETTTRSAFCRGFEVFAVADAMAASNEELHYNSLLALASGFGNIYSTHEIEELWKTP